EDVFVELHARPHAPQLPMLVLVLVSQPFPAMPSQSPKPMLHGPSAHVPFEQLAPAFWNMHILLHMPQLLADVLVSASQPSMGLLLQSANVPVHIAIWHMPPTHVPVAFAGEQGLLHMPQF